MKTNVSIDNNVIRIIELNEISESIPSDKRIKRMDSIIENESKFLLYFDGNSSVEDRIYSIFDSLDKASSFNNTKNAFNQAGFSLLHVSLLLKMK